MYIKIGDGLLRPMYDGVVSTTQNRADAIYLSATDAEQLCDRLRTERGIIATPVAEWELD